MTFLRLKSWSHGSEIIVNMDRVIRIERKLTPSPGEDDHVVVGSLLYYGLNEEDRDAVRATPDQIWEMLYPPPDPDRNTPRLYPSHPVAFGAGGSSVGGRGGAGGAVMTEQGAHMQRTDHSTMADPNRAWGWRCLNKECVYS